jgi:putative pyrroloquinoline-quinone binding quinoprotein
VNTLFRVLALAAALICEQASAASGTPVWTDTFDPMVGDTSAVRATAADDIVYVAGAGPFRNSPGSDADIHVRAYRVTDGNKLWEDVWDASGIHQDDQVNDLTISGRRLIIAGSAGTNTAGNNAFVVRAYDRVSGTPMWEDRCGQFASGARALAATSTQVFAAGICSPSTGGNTGLVRAYAARDGRQLWQADDLTFPAAITVSGSTVIVAGSASDGTLSLFAYDGANGRLLWNTSPAPSQGLTLISAHLTSSGAALYLAWSATDATSQVSNKLAAYDARTGRMRWQSDTGDRVNDLILDGSRLFTGEDGTQALVSAYAASNGMRVWQDQPGSGATPYVAAAVAVGGGQVFVAGDGFDPSVEAAPHFMVRAYDRSGRLLWHDDTPTGSVLGAAAADVVWLRGFVIAAGHDSPAAPPFGSTHWLVRAYSAPHWTHGP